MTHSTGDVISNWVDFVLLVCTTFTILDITQKICTLPGADERCPRRAASVVNQRTKLDAAITASESLLSIGIKKTKYYVDYYPYLWETVLVDLPLKQRAVGLFTLDALITSSCYLPTKLTRSLLERKSHGRARPRLGTIFKKVAWDWAVNILLAAGIGALMVALTDQAGKDKVKIAATCFGTRLLGGILIFILSRQGQISTLQGSSSGTITPRVSYAKESAVFSEVTNLAALSDFPGQTHFFQFHQSQAFTVVQKPQPCPICNHSPPHLTASGYQISGAFAVMRLAAKGYMDYLSCGSEDVSQFFGFEAGAPHPIVPMFLVRYYVGGMIDNGLDVIERLLQAIVWKIERECCPHPPPNYHFPHRVVGS